MKVDLHAHSNHSDGVLTPRALVQRAHARGVQLLALTDHDIVTGLPEAMATADELGLRLVPGVEISVTWGKRVVHVVGLGIDPAGERLLSHLQALQQARSERAQRIGARLQKLGVDQAYEQALQLAGGGNVTRTHFARLLVACGRADSETQAFDRFLSQGKPAYVSTQWASLPEAVGLINEAGGLAVIAHPARYKMTRTLLRELLKEFRQLGGAAIEVVNGGLQRDAIAANAALARQFELRASVGSDFHHPDNEWIDLGRLAPLPPDLSPVWHLLGGEGGR